MFNRFTVVMILQYIQILSCYAVHQKLIKCYMSIILQFLKSVLTTHTKKGNYLRLMNVLISLTVVTISQCIHR